MLNRQRMWMLAKLLNGIQVATPKLIDIHHRNLNLKAFKSATRKPKPKPRKRSLKPNMVNGNTTGGKPLGSKSTLGENHRFPEFYACYLLKSVKTPRSTA